MEHFVEEALKQAILKEKKNFDFYQRAARTVSDRKTKQMFELLACEEAYHMRTFLELYSGDEIGDLQNLMAPPDLSDPNCQAYVDMVDADTRQQYALEISLREEKACMDYYSALTGSIREPDLHAVFEQALTDTCNHYEMVKEEYNRIMDRDGEQAQ
ncbi:MAG TPA: ferritin family protein [Desulfuromonadaceae bacterium]|jgi:rubrerythrin